MLSHGLLLNLGHLWKSKEGLKIFEFHKLIVSGNKGGLLFYLGLFVLLQDHFIFLDLSSAVVGDVEEILLDNCECVDSFVDVGLDFWAQRFLIE